MNVYIYDRYLGTFFYQFRNKIQGQDEPLKSDIKIVNLKLVFADDTKFKGELCCYERMDPIKSNNFFECLKTQCHDYQHTDAPMNHLTSLRRIHSDHFSPTTFCLIFPLDDKYPDRYHLYILLYYIGSVVLMFGLPKCSIFDDRTFVSHCLVKIYPL